jgi:pimeloyl-ACP methyl ester carboxylesterase
LEMQLSQFELIDGVRLHFYEVGEGYPVLLLHGWGDNAEVMKHRWEAEINWPRGFKRVYLDLPGHGLSEVLDRVTCSDDILALALGFAKLLSGGSQLAVVGHSYGGYIAQGMVRGSASIIGGLCLLAPLVVADDEHREVPGLEVVEDDPECHGILPAEDLDMLDVLATRNRKVLGQIAKRLEILDRTPGNEPFLEAVRSDSSLYGCSFENEVLAKPYVNPTLIVTGRQDIVVGYKDAWRNLDSYSAATFVLLHGTGHLLEARETEISSHVERWLGRLPQQLAESP